MRKEKVFSLEAPKKANSREESVSGVLHITNGDAFNDYFLSGHSVRALPFREAMMDGDAVADVFGAQFVRLRTAALGVSEEEYRKKLPLIDVLCKERFALKEIQLWFGKDTFCQMNLLTLLACLEEINYQGAVTLNYIDDETFRTEEAGISVTLGIYKALYEKILVKKQKAAGGVLSTAAIDLYFDYHAEDGYLARLIKSNTDKNTDDLVMLLLNCSAPYGLSDRQALSLIEKHRKK